jgi:hypothetical protein
LDKLRVLGDEILNAKELRPSQGLVKDTNGNGWDLLGGEMGADEIVQDPVGIQASLESGLGFGIGVGFAAITSQLAAERTGEGFPMIGLNVMVIYVLLGCGMLGFWRLILGRLAAALVGLAAFVLAPYFETGSERFFGRPT